MSRLPTVAVVGFPKRRQETLVNRLVGGSERHRSRARCHPRPQAPRLRVERVAFELSTPAASTSRTSRAARDVQEPGAAGDREATRC